MVTAYIGLGANLGDPAQAVRDALAQLARLPQSALVKQSSLYASAPVDASGDDFINAVAQIDTTLSPQALLLALQQIESAFGRERPFRNAPRTLDLDLLLYGDEHVDETGLHVPHPRMETRAFVLLPLLELAPEIDIPGKGPARTYLAGVRDQAIAKIDGPGENTQK
jgi:2-amino-4-hydroxy-6-hydroxymethyldihydropteridine diphosphokinase